MIRSFLYVPVSSERFVAKAHDREADAIILEIEDAGRGMPQGGARLRDNAPALSVGLAGMRERMRQIGGIVGVESDDAGTRVHASVTSDAERVYLTVADDGPGVLPELRAEIFDRFVRAEGDRGGSVGLGLSIVRAVAQSHGGDVALDSPPEGGARFVVTLPASRAEAPSIDGDLHAVRV